MSNPNVSSSPLPPAPPSSFRGNGCLKAALFGCGGLVTLVILGVMGFMIWARSNSDELQSSGSAAVRAGARFGLETDEAGCLEEGKRRAGDASGFRGAFSAGTFVRSCLEFSRPTAGFCTDVPPSTSIRRSIAWQQERCSGDAGCAAVIGLVQSYCGEGQPKRTAADTLQFPADSTLGPAPPGPSAGDSASVRAEADSSGY